MIVLPSTIWWRASCWWYSPAKEATGGEQCLEILAIWVELLQMKIIIHCPSRAIHKFTRTAVFKNAQHAKMHVVVRECYCVAIFSSSFQGISESKPWDPGMLLGVAHPTCMFFCLVANNGGSKVYVNPKSVDPFWPMATYLKNYIQYIYIYQSWIRCSEAHPGLGSFLERQTHLFFLFQIRFRSKSKVLVLGMITPLPVVFWKGYLRYNIQDKS